MTFNLVVQKYDTGLGPFPLLEEDFDQEVECFVKKGWSLEMAKRKVIQGIVVNMFGPNEEPIEVSFYEAGSIKWAMAVVR